MAIIGSGRRGTDLKLLGLAELHVCTAWVGVHPLHLRQSQSQRSTVGLSWHGRPHELMSFFGMAMRDPHGHALLARSACGSPLSGCPIVCDVCRSLELFERRGRWVVLSVITLGRWGAPCLRHMRSRRAWPTGEPRSCQRRPGLRRVQSSTHWRAASSACHISPLAPRMVPALPLAPA